MEKQRFTRITFEEPTKKVTYEIPFIDITAGDVLDAMNTIALCLGFERETIINAAVEHIEMYSDRYAITQKGL